MRKALIFAVKHLGIVFFYVILVLNVFILLSGKTYLYEGIFQTYLQGRASPGIYDLDSFNKRIIPVSKPISWGNSTKTSAMSLSAEEEKYHQDYGSRAFIVLQNDTLVYEKYWKEHRDNKLSNSFSLSKSIVSLLVGIALDEKKIKSIDDPVAKYLPTFTAYGRKSLTLRHLLTMSSGLEWSESGSNPLSDNAEGYYTNNLRSLLMRQRVVDSPGLRFNYQSGNTQLLGYVIQKATGTSLSNYASLKLWKPLGAENAAYWSTDKLNGDEKSFCCFYATARDFARVGSLMVNKGSFNGKNIVSESYMNEAFAYADLSTKEGIKNQRYGLHFWIYFDGYEKVLCCNGLKGQFIIAIPSRKIVIVRIGNNRSSDVQLIDMFNAKRGGIDRSFIDKIGHPNDIFVYLKMVNRMLGVKRN